MVATDTVCGARRRGPLMLRPSLRPTPGSDMVDFTATATVLAWAMAAMAMEVLATDTERGPLRPSQRLTPGSDMVDFTATVLAWAMAAMAMEVLATDTERGPLRPSLRPMPGTDMVAFTATVLAWAMVMEVLATDTERGPLRPNLRPMPGTDMVASTATDSQPMAVTATDCGERSKHDQKHRLIITCNKPNDLIGLDP